MSNYILWRDVGLGQKTKLGDRCYGLNGWFTLDHDHVEKEPVVLECSHPIQRIVDNKDI